MDFPLTAEDTILLTAIGTVIVQLFKIGWVGLLKKPKPGENFLRASVFVVAVVWAYFDAGIELPPLDDPMAFALALFEAGAAVLIIADRAYVIILKPVLGWLDAKVLGRIFGAKAYLAP